MFSQGWNEPDEELSNRMRIGERACVFQLERSGLGQKSVDFARAGLGDFMSDAGPPNAIGVERRRDD